MAEAGEGLIESRAGGGLELAVRVVNDRTSFVSLPRDVLASLTARSPALPLPLALTPVERWLKRRGETAGPTTPKPAFVAWAGAASDGFGVVDVPAATADCLRLRDGCVVRVTGRAASPHATAVQLSPESEADWGLVVEHAGEILERTEADRHGELGQDAFAALLLYTTAERDNGRHEELQRDAPRVDAGG